MPRYYVNMLAQPNGNHEVHKAGCEQFPDVEDTLPLGSFTHIAYAVEEACRTFPQSIACQICAQATGAEKAANG